MKTPEEALQEILSVLAERPHIKVITFGKDSRNARILYTFPWFPLWEGRIDFWIKVNEQGNFRVQRKDHPLYPNLPSGDYKEMSWKGALDLALSWVRVWEDSLHPPQEPTFGMSLATATRKDALLAAVKAAALKAAVKGERSVNWLEYEGQDGLHRHFTPEELRNLLDINALVEHRDGRYDWYLNW